ncbi:glycosyltransferase involved in cell wall biosynthesis [Spirosoma oryzae]|uniref:Glycosyltransferase involved in cell wall biosynthesis n=1 Tax=Spirosoma oryzae TaxID=1469603 RepID=A0A2T0RGF2_9BACT|nr:glycosyltransferase family 2 protein [Spirosoma oryzae]PRY20286.1 glycosyltransferase involved in cell wall biosynthesis [Spirosoma oryzae]
MAKPLITIVTVVYNAKLTLEAAIKSVLSQKRDLFEYWIVDGGSTDGTVDIIRKYEMHLGGWISEPDKGIFDAMNKGIDRAVGEWMYFLGADDILCDGILEKISSYLKGDLAVVYGNVLLNNNYIMRSKIGMRCLLENRLHHQSAFYNRRLFNNFRYNQKFDICADYELTLRIYLSKDKHLYIPYNVAVFASGGKSDILTSKDINEIRGIYLQKPILNSLMSFIINSYYSYFRTKMFIKNLLRLK